MRHEAVELHREVVFVVPHIVEQLALPVPAHRLPPTDRQSVRPLDIVLVAPLQDGLAAVLDIGCATSSARPERW